jgi:hypothetical protein
LLFVLDLAEISSRIMAENTTLIDLHLEMFRGSIISTYIKCDSFIYGGGLKGLGAEGGHLLILSTNRALDRHHALLVARQTEQRLNQLPVWLKIGFV